MFTVDAPDAECNGKESEERGGEGDVPHKLFIGDEDRTGFKGKTWVDRSVFRRGIDATIEEIVVDFEGDRGRGEGYQLSRGLAGKSGEGVLKAGRLQ